MTLSQLPVGTDSRISRYSRARPPDSSKDAHFVGRGNFCIVMETQSESSHHAAARVNSMNLIQHMSQ